MEYLLEALIGLVLVLLIWLIVRTSHLSRTVVTTDKLINDIQIGHQRLTIGLTEFEKTMQLMIVSSLPRDGFPHQVEACWEDVGAHGRFLTDLGGMSIKMREQLIEEFIKALNKPIPTTPAAGSYNDVMLGLDEYLTEQYLQRDDELVLVRKHAKTHTTKAQESKEA